MLFLWAASGFTGDFQREGSFCILETEHKFDLDIKVM